MINWEVAHTCFLYKGKWKLTKKKHGMKSQNKNTISSKMYSAGAYSTVSCLFSCYLCPRTTPSRRWLLYFNQKSTSSSRRWLLLADRTTDWVRLTHWLKRVLKGDTLVCGPPMGKKRCLENSKLKLAINKSHKLTYASDIKEP